MIPYKRSNQRAGTGRPVSITSPITGWNARDALDQMAPTDAILLDNFFPRQSYVELRRGYSSHATGMGSSNNVETLAAYRSATDKLFAAAGGSIYDVTSSGAVGAAVSTGHSVNRWQTILYSGSLLWFNGTDTARNYNGSTWANATYTGTGLTATDLIAGMAFKDRLHLIEKDTMSFWYGGVGNITGALTEFDLSNIFQKGGTLLAVASWTRDGGNGADDYAVYVSSEGEVLVYQGSNPGDASDWSLVGRFNIARPIGRRCLMNYAGDVVAITEDGFLPFSSTLGLDTVSSSNAISDKISGAVKIAARNRFTEFGWECLLYSKGGYILFNIPNGGSAFHQYVVNTRTGAWCRFRNQDAFCWETCGGNLYFGGAGGIVYQADTGTSDNGSAIFGDGKSAFSAYGAPGVLKRLNLARPILSSEGDLPIAFTVDTNFQDSPGVYTPSTVSGTGTAWDSGDWDTSDWAADTVPIIEWRTIGAIGQTAAFRVRTQTTAQNVRWHTTDIILETGSGI